MRHVLLLGLLSLMFSGTALGQGTLKYTVKVFDQMRAPLKGLPVELEETSTGKKFTVKTDDQGEAYFEISDGKFYFLHVGKMKKLSTVEIPSDGISTGSQTVPYVPEMMVSRENLPDRTKLKLSVTDQSNMANPKPVGQNAVVKIVLKDRSGLKVKNTEVALTCIESSEQYVNKTDNYGVVKFLVPVGYLYHVDVDEVDYYQKVDLPKNFAGYETTLNVVYQPSNVVEKNVGDTIYQSVPKNAKSSATRAFTSIKVRNIKGQMLPNEYVFVRELNGSKVYSGVTDENGLAAFLLPLNQKYMISFQFEPDVDYIDLNSNFGRVNNVEYVLTYRPIERLANPGQFIPTPDQIFLNEFENFIDRQWPKPRNDGRLVDVVLRWGNKVNSRSKEAVLELEIVTPKDLPKNFKRDPINVCFVLDKSGSMAGYERIDSLKVALIGFIDRLQPNDIVSLVMFSDEPTLLVSSREKGDGEFLKQSISAVEPGGGTNIYKGLQMGFKEVQTAFLEGGVNRIVLLSDGYGSEEPKKVIDEVKGYVQQGVDISAIGVGEYYNYALMTQLASLSGGMMHYVGTSANMRETFSRELYSMVMTVAQDLKMEIVYNDKVVFKHLYGFDFTVKKPVATLEIPNVYAHMQKLGIAKFDLPKPTPEIEKHPVIVRYSYYNPSKEKREYFEEKAYLEWSPYTGKMELIKEHESNKLYAIALINQSIKVMADAFADKDYKKAQETVQECMNKIEELYPDAKDDDVVKLNQELKNYMVALNQQIENEQEELKKQKQKKDMN
ncbi:MAG: VWA domain-containing protein [Bacteroidetes bacterium]|nr:VWA domain-containing protein [Bacteroidota bacterium]